MVQDQIQLQKPEHGRDRFDGIVVANEAICREHFLLRIAMPTGVFPKTQPGQFVQIGCRTPMSAVDWPHMLGRDVDWNEGELPQFEQSEFCQRLALLRRPFSLAGRVETEEQTQIDLIHRVVGVGTDWLGHLKEGDPVDLIGPLGNQFALPEGKSIGLLCGGGVGLPPMFYLAGALADAGWRGVGFIGALSEDLLAVHFADKSLVSSDGDPAQSVQQFARHDFDAVITTDDGSIGLPGRITDGLVRYLDAQSEAERAKTVIFTCGPNPMMRAVAQLAEKYDIDCQVCVEQAMACGMGTCQSCVVQIEEASRPHGQTDDGRDWRYKLACTDGPVFDSRKVIW